MMKARTFTAQEVTEHMSIFPDRFCRKTQVSGAILALTGLVLSGCTIGEVNEKVVAGSSSPTASSSTSAETKLPSPDPTAADKPNKKDNATKDAAVLDIDAIQDSYGLQLAVAIANNNGSWSTPWNASNTAWSTIKVAIAIAALRHSPNDPNLPAFVDSAITYSDNDTALQLWNSLGDGETAATAVEQVLAEGGVTGVKVLSQVTRPGFSPFGQTDLTPLQEATFAKHLPSIPGAEPVLAKMGQIIPAHAYGLGEIDGARFKGGWGPGEQGGFDARQFGIVSTSCGDVGVALSSWNPSGDQVSSQQALSELAGQLTDDVLCSGEFKSS